MKYAIKIHGGTGHTVEVPSGTFDAICKEALERGHEIYTVIATEPIEGEPVTILNAITPGRKEVTA